MTTTAPETAQCRPGRRAARPAPAGFPFAPLAAAAGDPGVSALARQLGVTRRTVHRWQRAGVIPAGRADVAAVRLGHHPAEIWPIEWSAA